MIRIQEKKMQDFEREHIEEVRKIAPECTLFLKRENDAFPVKAGKVALYGSGARKTIKGGTGSGDVNVRHFITIEEGLEKAGFEITTKKWLDDYDALLAGKRAEFVEQIKQEAKLIGIHPMMYGMGKIMTEPEYELPLDADGEMAVYVLARISGEGSDRSNEISICQRQKSEISSH